MIITCTECHGEGPLPFKLKWEFDEEYCSECHNREVKVKEYYFCSSKCLRRFVRKFAGHNHDWQPRKFNDRQVCMKYDGNSDIVEIEEICGICDRRRWREVWGIERNLYKDQINKMKD